jgi:hypothetical protein
MINRRSTSIFFVSRPIIPPGDPHHPSESPKLLPTLLWTLLDKFCILLRGANLDIAAKKCRLGALSISEPSGNEADMGSNEAWLCALLATCSGVGDFAGRLRLPAHPDQLLWPPPRGALWPLPVPTRSSSSVRSSSWYEPSSSLSVHFVEHFLCNCFRLFVIT